MSEKNIGKLCKLGLCEYAVWEITAYSLDTRQYLVKAYRGQKDGDMFYGWWDESNLRILD